MAIVFACVRFEQYIFGQQVTVQSYHKPLETIFKKQLMKSPKRLQRMLLQLQKYDLNVLYKPGKELLIADTLSRDYQQGNVGKTHKQDQIIFNVLA